jgi:hypothetical protein
MTKRPMMVSDAADVCPTGLPLYGYALSLHRAEPHSTAVYVFFGSNL